MAHYPLHLKDYPNILEYPQYIDKEDLRRIMEEDLEFCVETADEVDAIVKHYGAEGMEYEGGSESLQHVCHVKSPHGMLYFYAPDEEIARDIWEHWFPEHREARKDSTCT